MEEINLPQFKAERLDGKGEVEGYYNLDDNTHYISRKSVDMWLNYKINLKTLKQKIGDGWYKMEEVENFTKEIQALKKDRDYWKLSFNKQVDWSRR